MLRGPMSRIISSAPTLIDARPRARARWPRISAPPRRRPAARSRSPWPSALARMSRAVSARSCSASDLPTGLPCAARKVLAMPPPMISTSTLAIRLPSRSSLVDTLAPPTMAATGRCGASSALLERLELGLHGAARIGGQLVGEALGRGVRAMRGREGVVDVDVAERRQLARRRPGRSFPRRRGSGCSPAAGRRPACSRATAAFGLVADAILRERDRPPEHVGDRGGDRLAATASDRAPWAGRNARAGSPCRPCRRSRGWSAPRARCGSRRATLPFSIGTLRSTRTSTRLPLRSA